MYDWIEELGPGRRVLDVGSGPGSFPTLQVRCTVVSLDEDVDAFTYAASPAPGHVRIFGRSWQLPFAAATFDLVVCHHVMEHITEVEATLAEIRRVLKPDGRLFVSIPNGYGLCDGVYRFVFQGGGHVNRFRREQLVTTVERGAGVRLLRWQKLYSSFVYLWRLAEMGTNPPAGLTWRTALLCRLPRKIITTVQRLLYSGSRRADRLLHTDLAVYGWAFYFDRTGGAAVERPAMLNVCRCCGAGHEAAGLEHPAPGKFRCHGCNAATPYFAPFGNTV